MYPMLDEEPAPVSDEEMKEVMKHGRKIIVADGNLEVTGYLYKDRIYIYDVRDIDRGE